jgi:hypothetical protein
LSGGEASPFGAKEVKKRKEKSAFSLVNRAWYAGNKAINLINSTEIERRESSRLPSSLLNVRIWGGA